MLITSTRGQRGITLIEIILVCAIVAAAAAGLFVFAKKTSVTAAVEKEQRQVEDIVKTVDSMFALQPNFAALGTNGAEHLSTHGAARAGLNLTKGTGGAAALKTALGSGELNLAAWNVDTGTGPAVPNSGYRLAYQGLTANECSRLVTATYSIAHQVSVARNGLDDSGATGLASRGKLTASPEQIAETCSGSRATSVFLYFAPARAIAAATAAPPAPAPRCNPVHETQQVACPAGQIGSIKQERDGTCTGPGNALVYTAWTTTDNTCAAAITPPPTVTPPVVADSCSTETFTRVEACPAGQTGHIIQQRTLDSCAGTYTPWTTTSTTCHSPDPGATCVPTTEERTLSCPPGQASRLYPRSSRCAHRPAPHQPPHLTGHLGKQSATPAAARPRVPRSARPDLFPVPLATTAHGKAIVSVSVHVSMPPRKEGGLLGTFWFRTPAAKPARGIPPRLSGCLEAKHVRQATSAATRGKPSSVAPSPTHVRLER